MEYLLHILVLLAVYGLLAYSLDILVGHSGILSLAHAAFYGIGAYTGAILAINTNLNSILVAFISMLVVAGFGLIFGLLTAQTSRQQLPLASLAFGMIVFIAFMRWDNLTNGPLGISSVPKLLVWKWTVDSPKEFALVTILSLALAWLVIQCVLKTRLGFTLHLLRDDEILAASLGKRLVLAKLCAFALSSALAGLAGVLHAYYIGYVDPTPFGIFEGIMILAMVIIGGPGSRVGPIAGVSVLVLLQELLRFVGIPAASASNVRQIIYGLALIIIIVQNGTWSPTGNNSRG